MKQALGILSVFLFVGCGPKELKVNSHDLPTGWSAGRIVSDEEIYSDPPKSTSESHILIIGLRPGDTSHRFYSIPMETPVADVVRVFEVGAHGSASYGYDADKTVALVAKKATAIAELIPCRVTFADSAGLKLRFLRKIENKDLDQLLKLFPESDGFQSGAEKYIIEQEKGRHMFQSVKDENLFHFWWD